jgi:hypothetical protein
VGPEFTPYSPLAPPPPAKPGKRAPSSSRCSTRPTRATTARWRTCHATTAPARGRYACLRRCTPRWHAGCTPPGTPTPPAPIEVVADPRRMAEATLRPRVASREWRTLGFLAPTLEISVVPPSGGGRGRGGRAVCLVAPPVQRKEGELSGGVSPRSIV